MPNQGKICVAVSAATSVEMMEKIRASEGVADIVEIRFDGLEETEVNRLVEMLKEIRVPLLITFRPREQGGFRELTFADRIRFWETIIPRLEGLDFIVDHEIDVDFALNLDPSRVVLSMHDFDGTGESLSADAFMELNGGTIKIAVTANDATDAIKAWNLLRRTEKPYIPIAMGEAGKWTRILGPAHGAPITYASPDDGTGTAPGQISASDLRDVFRVKELDRETEVFGVVAGDTSYSLSPFMQNAAFEAAGMNRVFVPWQVSDLDAFIRRMVRPSSREVELNFGGLSVTNPHKQEVMRHLDEIHATAKAIGAVNTVKVDGDRLIGYNTDAPGFIAPLEAKLGSVADAQATVVGAGGAARACIYALKQAGATVTVRARDAQKASKLAGELEIASAPLTNDEPLTTDILVNATPLGTRGQNEDATIATADHLQRVKLVYDLVYNPTETRLIREARTAGIETLGGLDMLVAQGVKQFEIWTGSDAPVTEMRKALEKRLQ